MNSVTGSLQLMVYGLAGVFFALAVLFVSVKIVTKVFPPRKDDE